MLKGKSRDELISENIGLVHSCANKFRGRGIEYEELFSAGCLGLVKAADGFDSTLGFRFSTYAVPVILGEIKRLFRDGGAVKISRSLKEKSKQALKLRDELSIKLDREPTVRELARELNVSEFEAVELLNVSYPTVSLTATDEQGEHQIDIPVDFGEEKIHNSIALKEVICTMPEQDRQLIELRYYKGMTQTTVAEKLGLSQVQVSRKERSILTEMRRKMTG